MKYEFNGKFIVAEAENANDNLELLATIKTKEQIVGEVKKRKKHKKHAFTKICPKCGRECKGLMGLGIHMSKHKKDLLDYPSLPTLIPINKIN